MLSVTSAVRKVRALVYGHQVVPESMCSLFDSLQDKVGSTARARSSIYNEQIIIYTIGGK